MIVPQPKPTPRKRVNAKAKRVESTHAQQVRALVVERDGSCRLADPALWLIFGACSGESEFAHMPERRRSKTRGMDPKIRHDKAHTLMLCTKHHAMADRRGPRPWMQVQPASSRGAEGRLAFQIRDTVHVESERR
jgi:hypothetical protein